MDPLEVKKESERTILALGGQILDWLPFIDEDRRLRSREEIVSRALIVNAMLNIAFKAPIPVIKNWISAQGLDRYLAPSEQAILAKSNDQLTEQENTNLCWYIEALWALMWLGGLIDVLPIDRPVENYMASLTPNLQRGEDGWKFTAKMQLRSRDDVYRMLDLYYRAMWYARNGQLNGYPTPGFVLDIIMERRKALEWALDPDECDWDSVESGT